MVFAALAATEANVLILDEPTNHLDIESVEALIHGLNGFGGGIVVSTHDARVVEGLDECEVWVCGEGKGGLRSSRRRRLWQISRCRSRRSRGEGFASGGGGERTKARRQGSRREEARQAGAVTIVG